MPKIEKVKRVDNDEYVTLDSDYIRLVKIMLQDA